MIGRSLALIGPASLASCGTGPTTFLYVFPECTRPSVRRAAPADLPLGRARSIRACTSCYAPAYVMAARGLPGSQRAPELVHIAIDVRLGAGSGVGTVIRNVVPLLARAGHRLTLIGRGEDYGDLAAQSGVELIEFGPTSYSLMQHARYPRHLERTVDVLHVPHYVTPFGWRGPLVATINDLTHLAPSMPTSRAQRAYVRFFVRRTLRVADVTLTLSQTSRREIIKQFGPAAEFVRAVHCGVDRAHYLPSDPVVARAHADAVVGAGVPYIQFLSSVRPHKNLDGLLLAFAHLKSTVQLPHRLLVVGEREGFIVRSQALHIEERVMRDVVFGGYVDEAILPHLYSACSVFAFPSFSEGFGLPPLEAMSCGAPVVSSNASSLPEVLGDAALYVNPADPTDIAAGVGRVLSSPELAADLSARGIAHSTEFPWSHTAAAYATAYEDAIRLHRRTA